MPQLCQGVPLLPSADFLPLLPDWSELREGGEDGGWGWVLDSDSLGHLLVLPLTSCVHKHTGQVS